MEHGEGSKGKRPLDVGQDALPKAKRNQLVLFENDQYVKREATSTVQPGGGSQRVAPFTPLRSISSDGPRTEGSRMPVSAQQPLTAMPPPLAPRPAHLPRPGPHFFANPAARQAPIVDYQLMLEITSGRYHPYSRIAVPVARILMHPMFVPVMPPLHPQFHPVVVLVVPVMMMEIPIQAALPPQPAQVHQMPQLYLQQQMQQQMQQQLQQQMQQQMQQQLQQQLQQQTQPQMYQAPPPWQQNLNQVVANVENQLGHPLRADGPILGVEFDDPPPSAHQGPQE